jgi:hypothetical protein
VERLHWSPHVWYSYIPNPSLIPAEVPAASMTRTFWLYTFPHPISPKDRFTTITTLIRDVACKYRPTSLKGVSLWPGGADIRNKQWLLFVNGMNAAAGAEFVVAKASQTNHSLDEEVLGRLVLSTRGQEYCGGCKWARRIGCS